MTTKDLIHQYQERVAICIEDGKESELKARQIARKEIIEVLVESGMSKADAYLEAVKIERES